MLSTLTLALCPLLLAPAPPVEEDWIPEAREYLQRLEKLGFSGAVVIARAGKPTFTGVYGLADRAKGVPVKEDTVFPLGSITKHFTAAAILRLEMDEMISVEDPIEYYFEDLPKDRGAITIHQLLTHSSGLPGYSGEAGGRLDLEGFVRACMSTELAYPPGRGRVYSNLGYGLLAAIVERASEIPFEQYLREKIFLPARMNQTGTGLPKWEGTLAHGYIDDRDAGTLFGDQGISWGLIGAGGLMTTVGDMQRWSAGLRQYVVLNEPSFRKMTTPHAGTPELGTGYGCGIHQSVKGTPWFGHNGSNDVFSADFRHYPEDDLMIFAVGNNAEMYSFDVTPSLEGIVLGVDVELPPRVLSMEKETLSRYAGSWFLPSGEEIEVSVAANRLTVASSDPMAAGLLHPVRPLQVERRKGLIQALEAGFRSAFEGEFAPLHQLLDPFVSEDDFIERLAGRFDAWIETLGEPRSVRAVPGRNRFGEIAIVCVLGFASGERKIEYSFGEQEVGSIRLLEEFPQRIVLPESPTSFVSFDLERGEVWRIEFELEDESPSRLILTDEAGQRFQAGRDR